MNNDAKRILVTGIKSDIEINAIVAINRSFGLAKDVRVIAQVRENWTEKDVDPLESNGAYILEQIWEVPDLVFNFHFFKNYSCKVYFGFRGDVKDIPQDVKDLFDLIYDLGI